jgi:hypothetical protein
MRPKAMEVKTEHIPGELKSKRKFVLWKWEEREGRLTKPPYQVNGKYARSDDPKTWTTFDVVMKALRNGDCWDGIGFMLTPPYIGIDLDNCRDPETGQIRDWATSILQQFKSYSEVSPSAAGVKILGKGKLMGPGHHSDRIGVFQNNRYFCITGHVINGCSEIRSCQKELDNLIKREWPDDFERGIRFPQQPIPSSEKQQNQVPKATKEDFEIYDKAANATNGDKFLKLWKGDIGDYPSPSEADAALCSILAFWTQDGAQIDRMFRGSGLYRDKWERKDYRERTIGRALKDRKETYKEPKKLTGGAPTMAELRQYIDLQVQGGQFFTAHEICTALAATKKEHKGFIYTHLSRLVQDKVLRKDPYRHGGYRKVLQIAAYDMAGDVESETFDLDLPLELDQLIDIEPNHLISIAGSTDAGKSAFLFHTMKKNYREHRIIHFSSPEWDQNAIKKRMDKVGIDRPHPNITCYPMEPGYEDLIPPEPCIVLVDYLRTTEQFNELDRQYHAILNNLKGGVAFAAIQKHIGSDKPTGGQYAVHAAHHVILLDPWKDAFVCKIFKTKNERHLRGYYRVFDYKNLLLKPVMKDWKKGKILWGRPPEREPNKPNETNEPNMFDVRNPGGV